MAFLLTNPSVSATIANLYLNSELADSHFIFKSDDEIQKIPVHKLFLAMKSPVFDAMFFGAMKEQNDIEIVDADIQAFREFLQLFYLTNVTLTMEHMETVIRLTDKYDIMRCVHEMCATLPKEPLTSENIFYIYQLAIYADYFPLVKICERKIIDLPSMQLVQSDTFIRIDKKILTYLLELDFKCDEIGLIYASLSWARHACEKSGMDTRNENLRAQLGDCLKLFRFFKLAFNQFIDLIKRYQNLLTAEEFQDIVLMQKVPTYNPKIFNRCDRRYEWNAGEVLLCDRKPKNFEKPIVNHLGPEIIAFTSNKPVLLGEIYVNARLGDLNVLYTIMESGTRNSKSDSKMIYRDFFQTGRNDPFVIHLYKPVLMKPHILYEIHLHIKKTCVFTICKSTIEMEHGIKIDFHRSTSLSYDNSSISCISSLGFNRIANCD